MRIRAGMLGGAALAVLGCLATAAPAAASIAINPIFASAFTCSFCGINPASVVSLQGNAAAEAAVDAAISQISSQFNGGLSTNILFYGAHAGPGGFLAGSLSGHAVYSYSQYTGALAADAAANPSNGVLATAVGHLGSGNGAGDPLAFVAPTTADARTLGLGTGALTAYGLSNSTPQFDSTGDFLGGGGTVDGVVFVNLDQPLSFTRPIQPVSAGIAYDARSSIEHEVDEILGIGGGGSQLNNANADPNYAVDAFGVNGTVYGSMDLYRYQAPGVASFDPYTVSVTGCPSGLSSPCSGLPSPYFSIDGGLTAIDEFNQAFPLIGGDAGDWGLDFFKACPDPSQTGGSGDVQDAFSCSNQIADVTPGTPAYKALEAIGYGPAAAIPEPAGWAILLLGFFGLGAVLRSRAAATPSPSTRPIGPSRLLKKSLAGVDFPRFARLPIKSPNQGH